MTEYIKMKPLISDLEDVIADYKDVHAFSADFAATIVIDILNNIVKCQPAADVAPVVRCKDCIRRYDTDECPMCFLSEGKYYEYTNGNGYCDRGERKQVGTDY